MNVVFLKIEVPGTKSNFLVCNPWLIAPEGQWQAIKCNIFAYEKVLSVELLTSMVLQWFFWRWFFWWLDDTSESMVLSDWKAGSITWCLLQIVTALHISPCSRQCHTSAKRSALRKLCHLVPLETKWTCIKTHFFDPSLQPSFIHFFHPSMPTSISLPSIPPFKHPCFYEGNT